MSEEEIWLLFMHAAISRPNCWGIYECAVLADDSLEEWRKRYGEEQGSETEKG